MWIGARSAQVRVCPAGKLLANTLNVTTDPGCGVCGSLLQFRLSVALQEGSFHIGVEFGHDSCAVLPRSAAGQEQSAYCFTAALVGELLDRGGPDLTRPTPEIAGQNNDR